MTRSRFIPDNFTLLLTAAIVAATMIPCRGTAAVVFNVITNIAIGLLFFMHGAKLSREAVVAGITHWRLHLLIFACTFAMFPVLGIALRPLLEPLVTPELYVGMLSCARCRPLCSQPSPSRRWRGATWRVPCAARRRRA